MKVYALDLLLNNWISPFLCSVAEDVYLSSFNNVFTDRQHIIGIELNVVFVDSPSSRIECV